MPRILVVDDDRRIVKMVEQFLVLNGMSVIPAYDGKDAIALMDERVDLVLLDVNMSEMGGMETCQWIRQRYKVPILFLSANTSTSDKILGLGYGADDYITKPFDPMELIARIHAHLRRRQEYNEVRGQNKILRFGDFTFNKSAHRVMKGDQELVLSSTEFRLLSYLIEHPNVVFSRKTLLAEVWESEYYDENTVTAYIKRLRQKIRLGDDDQAYIKSVRGVGYIFEAELETVSGS